MQGFYNSTDGTIHVPNITKPIDDDVARAMRHAYMAAVSWMDQQLGRVLDELQRLGLAENTVVLLHGEADVTTCLALVCMGVSGGGGEGNVCLGVRRNSRCSPAEFGSWQRKEKGSCIHRYTPRAPLVGTNFTACPILQVIMVGSSVNTTAGARMDGLGSGLRSNCCTLPLTSDRVTSRHQTGTRRLILNLVMPETECLQLPLLAILTDIFTCLMQGPASP